MAVPPPWIEFCSVGADKFIIFEGEIVFITELGF